MKFFIMTRCFILTDDATGQFSAAPGASNRIGHCVVLRAHLSLETCIPAEGRMYVSELQTARGLGFT